MKIIVDLGGCDHPEQVAQGIALTLQETTANIVAFGNAQLIQDAVANVSFDPSRLEIVHAEEEITNNDQPMSAIRAKKNSSLVLALKRLATDEQCGAIVSAGSTGAVLCGATVILGRKPNVERPTLCTIMPNKKGTFSCIADCGANVDCRPEQLVTFATLAEEYMSNAYGIDKPTVATLSVGSEEKKGNQLVKSTIELLKQTQLNFVGNIEAKDILNGDVDVIVCDGFDGNVLLKCVEGTAMFVAETFVKQLKAALPSGVDGTFIKTATKQLMQQLDFTSMGGAVLLGVNKLAVKAHGAANAQTVKNCVLQAMAALR